MLVARYETTGTEVEHPDFPQINCGYDNIATGYMIVRDDDMLADYWADGDYRKLDVVAEVDTIGL